MDTYVILRRNGWASPEDLEEAAGRSAAVGDEMADEVRWIRTYVLGEADGSVGTVCIYQGVSEDAVRRQAERAGIPCDEVVKVADTVIVRPDPVAAV